jgi:hypothetical protein
MLLEPLFTMPRHIKTLFDSCFRCSQSTTCCCCTWEWSTRCCASCSYYFRRRYCYGEQRGLLRGVPRGPCAPCTASFFRCCTQWHCGPCVVSIATATTRSRRPSTTPAWSTRKKWPSVWSPPGSSRSLWRSRHSSSRGPVTGA